MEIPRNKTKIATIAFVLLLTISVASLAVNTAEAITWHPYIVAAPNPVGVGQRVLIVFGFTMPTVHAMPSYNDWTLIITDPGGNEMTMGPYNCESTGSTFAIFVPDEVGTWKLKASYPGGDVYFAGDVWLTVPAATTDEFVLTVQQEPLPEIPWAEPPTDYWEYPIYAENRGWQAFADNWLMPGYDTDRQFDWGGMSGPFAPYTTTPKTAHILWTKPTLFGGLIGGPYGDVGYYTGLAYRRELQPPVIINGRLYYNQMEPPRHGFYCVDLSTGETIWFNNATYPDGQGGLVQGMAAQITCGQILELDTRNWHGGWPFLWSTVATTWAVWDPWTGDLLWTIVNAPPISTDMVGPSFVMDDIGSLCAFRLDPVSSTLAMWNSSKLIHIELADPMGGGLDGLGSGMAPHVKYNLDWNNGIQWNVTVPDLQAPPPMAFFGGHRIITWDPKDWNVIIVSNQTLGNVLACEAFEDIAISAKDGSVLWRKIRNEGTWEYVVGGRAMSMEEGVYTIVRKETRQVYAYSISTGAKLWESDPRPNQWGMYLMGMAFAYGKVYVVAYDGECRAHDAQTGDLAWRWGPVDAGLETPYGVYPIYGGLAIADDKIWVFHGEHSADTPLYRGEAMYGIDKDTGDTVWSISGWYQQPVFANGKIVAPNGYDGQIYCFGKGKTATTVSASPKVVAKGASVLIQGTVTDQSPGAKDTAAIADEYMSEWMEYLYMQKPIPTEATGVPVLLQAICSNGTLIDIGWVTSDMMGHFETIWTPPAEDTYKILAMFLGSDSYWMSNAQTALGVGPAPAEPEPTEAPAYTAIDLVIIAAVVVAIVVGLYAIVSIRKLRK